MKKILLVVAVVVVLAAVAAFLLWPKGPDLTKYEPLKEPQINKLEKQKVIAITLTGDPEKISGEAIGALYKVYFKLKDVDKSHMIAPKARWTGGEGTPKDKWSAEFAIQVPEEVVELPEIKDGPKIDLKYWEYGETAEILHIGSYDDEKTDIERLNVFVKDNNYRVTGKHEEEYIKGPGMFGKGDPKNYWTVLRYTVTKGKAAKKSAALPAKKPAKSSSKKTKK